MKSNENAKNVKNSKSGEVDHPLLPKLTKDEVDLEIDTNRDDEMFGISPLITVNFYSLLFGSDFFSVFISDFFSPLAAGFALESVL